MKAMARPPLASPPGISLIYHSPTSVRECIYTSGTFCNVSQFTTDPLTLRKTRRRDTLRSGLSDAQVSNDEHMCTRKDIAAPNVSVANVDQNQYQSAGRKFPASLWLGCSRRLGSCGELIIHSSSFRLMVPVSAY